MQYILKDPINRLHWNTIKSILLTLSLLPAASIFQFLWNFSNQSDQLIIRFFALNLICAWTAISFYIALRTHHNTIMPNTNSSSSEWALKLYCHLPMVFFTTFVAFLHISYIV